MQIERICHQGIEIAHIQSNTIVLYDLQSAIDLMMTAYAQTGSKNIAIAKNRITEDFFVLRTGLAGEILQKFINYQFHIAIYGDFSMYTSKSLKDFIYESNHGKDIFFVESLDAAIKKFMTSTIL